MAHYQHLSRQERDLISVLKAEGASLRAIGLRLGRDPSTISRELRRNCPPVRTGYYLPHKAQARAAQRASLSHTRPRLKTPVLRRYVHRQLARDWSPEQMAGRLPTCFPNLSISHEAIYQYIYAEAQDLIALLPKAHRRRQKRGHRHTHRSSHIPHRVPITERPPEVETRQQMGHWECDTAVSRQSLAALAVAYERKSRLVKIKRIPQKTAHQMRLFLTRRLSQGPAHRRQTLTYDNGSENVAHEQVNAVLKTKSYFCTPYHSWEKGGVEHSIGEIRRYFPKKTDFATLTDHEVQRVERRLNNRPRKCLGYRTPREVYQAGTVALAG